MNEFITKYGSKLLIAILQHIGYVTISSVAACVIAVFLGILLSRFPRYSKIVMPFLGIFQTIPGIVFIGILMMYTGMTPLTVIIALTIYAIFPILKNTYIGLTEIDKSYIEVAQGCGMTNFQILFRIELPMAMAVIFAGIKMSVTYTVSWAVLAAMIGQGGLGEFIYRGIDANVKEYIIIGSIPTALLAIVFKQLIEAIEKKCISPGLKEEQQ